MTIKLICKHHDVFREDPYQTIEFIRHGPDLNDCIDIIQDFLKGCGFNLDGKHLEVVDDDAGK